jgi:hypothetical protein
MPIDYTAATISFFNELNDQRSHIGADVELIKDSIITAEDHPDEIEALQTIFSYIDEIGFSVAELNGVIQANMVWAKGLSMMSQIGTDPVMNGILNRLSERIVEITTIIISYLTTNGFNPTTGEPLDEQGVA